MVGANTRSFNRMDWVWMVARGRSEGMVELRRGLLTYLLPCMGYLGGRMQGTSPGWPTPRGTTLPAPTPTLFLPFLFHAPARTFSMTASSYPKRVLEVRLFPSFFLPVTVFLVFDYPNQKTSIPFSWLCCCSLFSFFLRVDGVNIPFNDQPSLSFSSTYRSESRVFRSFQNSRLHPQLY